MRAGSGHAWCALALLFAVRTVAFDTSRARAEAVDSLYETQRVARVLRQRELAIDPQPEGKRIAFVALAEEDVFAADELVVPVVLPRLAPTWPNTFHAVTSPEVIERELLIGRGDRYETARVEESMRNLRALFIFAYVRIVAVRTPDPQQVGLLVYTRDLWSLRLETLFDSGGDALYLTALVSERNFLGKNKVLSARFALDPKAFSLGELYADPRVLGGQLQFSESFDVIFNRSSGDTEGSQAELTLERPFRSLDQTGAWNASLSYSVSVFRELTGSDVDTYRPAEGDGDPIQCETPDPACVQAIWGDRRVRARVTKSYRRGTRYKQTFTFGVGASDRKVNAVAETELMPGQESTLAQLMPFTRRQVYPLANYDLWLPNYAVYRNLGTFGQSESVRLGPSVYAGFAAPLSAFGSSTDSLTFAGSLRYVLGDGNALAEASTEASARLENGRVVDQQLGAVLRGATPDALLGRLVLYAAWDARRNDTARTPVSLGGDTGLRGFQYGQFHVRGGSRLRTNLEYRTLPLVVQSVHLGAVLFYDLGSVYGSLSSVTFHHSVGAGLRVLFSQFNHTPFCADVGVPLDGHGFFVLGRVSSAQPVPLTASEDALGATVRPR